MVTYNNQENAITLSHGQILALLPPWLQSRLAVLRQECGGELYLSGGSLRDLLLGRVPHDIDLTVARHAAAFACRLAEACGGTCICLDAAEDVARVVRGSCTIDIAAFREGAATIEEDLRLRDFTINALAVSLNDLFAGAGSAREAPLTCLDPTGGLADISKRLVRMTHENAFRSDPLRMLRAYRLAASLDCTLEASTSGAIGREYALIARSAAERVAAELNGIMLSPNGYAAIEAMAANNLLFAVIPELAAGMGLEQPESHHLDVLGHSLEALRQIELLIARPESGFPECSPAMRAYLAETGNILVLKWAALLHDVGKPATWAQDSGRGGRITFYQHERAGVALVQTLAERLRWSSRQRERVNLLVSQHMRPFHLLNVARQGTLTLKACIRLVQALGDELTGLLVLAQADARAGRGEQRPDNMEHEVAEFARRLEQVRCERVLPVQTGPPLLRGGDLIVELGLTPGPLFKTILAQVELERMEGTIQSRDEALRLARTMAVQGTGTGG